MCCGAHSLRADFRKTLEICRICANHSTRHSVIFPFQAHYEPTLEDGVVATQNAT